MNSLWIAKTGMEAQQLRMAVIANNLANVNTTGFKQERAAFQDLMYQNLRQVGAQSSQNTQLPSGLALGTGVRSVATQKLHLQGNVTQTGNSLDVAIDGRGFFQVIQADGTPAFTRDGSFQIDAQGTLVTNSGFQIQPALIIPPDAQSITVARDGTVSVAVPGQAQPTQIGTLELTDFTNPSGLEAIGNNLFLESAASGAPIAGTPGINGLGGLLQGALETSNVNSVEEMIQMIETQRAYELSSRAISTSDEMLETLSRQL
jgi:flagellar basal-body rod protein FlgG